MYTVQIQRYLINTENSAQFPGNVAGKVKTKHFIYKNTAHFWKVKS